MAERDISLVVITVLGIFVSSGFVIVIAGMRQRTRRLEMAHRERLAMIEKGLLPPPERDPAAFAHDGWHERRHTRTALRMKSAGIIVIGFGLALTTVISVASEAPTVGIGVGGAITIVGLAFLVNAMVTGYESTTWHHPPTPGNLPPPPPPGPPTQPE